jgi:pyruvate dehydrogenase E1 component alpha subunit
LIAQGILTGADAQEIETAARAEMDAAVNYALASPLPAPEEATNHIFA